MVHHRTGLLAVALAGVMGLGTATADAGAPVRRFPTTPQVVPSTARFVNPALTPRFAPTATSFYNPAFAPRTLPQYTYNPGFVARPYSYVPPYANVVNPYPYYIYNSGLYPYASYRPIVPYNNPFPCYGFGPVYGNSYFNLSFGLNYPY